jgi:hypothetical protein
MRIHAERRFLPADAPPATIFRPFWGGPPEDPRDPMSGRFAAFDAGGAQLFALVDAAEADCHVLPAHWEAYRGPEASRLAEEAAARATAHGKPLVVFYVSDDTAPVPLTGATVFRTSLYRSRRRANEHAMPAFVRRIGPEGDGAADAIEPKPPRPIVSFCGSASRRPTVARVARSVVGRLRGRDVREGHVRAEACGLLERDDRIDTSFVIRDAFWAGAVRLDGSVDHDRMQVARREFTENMLGSHYVLCARGGGNFSYRLYETLSAGRTPVFIDTDCVLPWEDEIDWRSLCVWVDESQLDSIGDRVVEFHERLDDDGFAAQRQQCRATFDRYLSAEGFFAQLASGRWLRSRP